MLGPQTIAAVKALQRRARLASGDLLGSRTLSALGRLGRPRYGTRTLRRGLVGLDVAGFQFELRYHGFPNRGRGVFDAQTASPDVEPSKRWTGHHRRRRSCEHRFQTCNTQLRLGTPSSSHARMRPPWPPFSPARSSSRRIALGVMATPSSRAMLEGWRSRTHIWHGSTYAKDSVSYRARLWASPAGRGRNARAPASVWSSACEAPSSTRTTPCASRGQLDGAPRGSSSTYGSAAGILSTTTYSDVHSTARSSSGVSCPGRTTKRSSCERTRS